MTNPWASATGLQALLSLREWPIGYYKPRPRLCTAMRQPALTSVQSVAPSSRGFSAGAPRGGPPRPSSSQGPPSTLMWSLPLPLDPSHARRPRFKTDLGHVAT